MATTIVTKKGSGAPAASDLVEGELAVDTANGRLYTENSSAAVVELGSNPSGNITFGDNGKAIFGAGSDLQIYHDGSHSYISDSGTGYLRILASDYLQLMSSSSEVYLNAAANGGVTLYHDNSGKISTTATGIDVTGTATVDGLVVGGSATGTITLGEAGYNGTIQAPHTITLDAQGAGESVVIKTQSTERMRIDSSGKLVAGRSSAYSGGKIQSFVDHTSGFASPSFTAADSTAMALGVGGEIGFFGKYSSADDYAFYGGIKGFKENGTDSNTACALSFYTRPTGTAPQESMRIDSSGNLLVGKTATSLATAGIALMSNDQVRVTTASDNPLELNRLSNDGDLIRCYADTGLVGSIGTANSGDLYIGNDDTTLLFAGGSDAIIPRGTAGATRDAAIDLGLSAHRFKDLYLSSGVVFGATGGAVTSKTLDDYEEGTWTPTVASNASPGGYTYQVGYYTKVGRKVHVTAQIKISSVGNFAGATININGLPYTIANVTTYDPTGILVIKGAAVAKSDMFSRGVANTNYARIEQGNGTTNADMNCNADVFDTDTICYFDLTYFTS